MKIIYAIIGVASIILSVMILFIHKLVESKIKFEKNVENQITISLEEAYFDGQRDAIRGHVVIKFDTAKNVFVWTDSPWDSRKPAQFIPTQKDNQVSKYKN